MHVPLRTSRLRKMGGAALGGLLAVGLMGMAAAAAARPHHAPPRAPKVLLIGNLYASSGAYAYSSESSFSALQFWAHEVNAQGGVYVKAFRKKIPVKIIAYNDQSSTSLATTLYTQLITQDHVNLLVSDFGSVLTSVGVPVAKEHHMVLFDEDGTGSALFTPPSPYLVLCSAPYGPRWPINLGKFLIARHISRVAILYAENDFDVGQAVPLRAQLAKAGIHPVFYAGVPTNTTSYATVLHSIAATHPDAVVEFGYDQNDIAFLQALGSSGLHFPMVYTPYVGLETSLLVKDVGAQGVMYTYSYAVPPVLEFRHVNVGLSTSAFVKAYTAYAHQGVNFNTVTGYNTGLVMQAALARTTTFTQLGIRHAIAEMSGKVDTLEGPFAVNAFGGQIGQTNYLGQMVPNGHGGVKEIVVYPLNQATGKARYPTPTAKS